MRKQPAKRALLPVTFDRTIHSLERRLLMSTYTVNTLSDAINPPEGELTLRQAVADANAHAGADTIVFDPKVFAAGSLHTVTLTQGQIVFTDTSGSTTVDGPGSGVLAVDGNQSNRVVQISSGATVSISGLTITGGATNTSAGVLSSGGGVQNAGSLTLSDVTVSKNSAMVSGVTGTDPFELVSATAEGGGIANTGILTLAHCTVTGNTATGGSNYGDERADGASNGGGIYSTGSLTITDSAVSDNKAAGGTNTVDITTGGDARGGAIYTTGPFLMTSTTVSDNSAKGGWCLQTEGGGAPGGAAFGGSIFATGVSTITGSTLTGNIALAGYSDGGGDEIPSFAWGGAIFSTGSLTVGSSSFAKNEVTGGARPLNDNGVGGNGYGGAIAAEGPLTITGSTLSSNSALGGSASETGSGPGSTQSSSAFGGAIYSTKSLVVFGSTLSGNLAQGPQSDDLYGSGGGYAQGGAVFTGGTATIEASSLIGNTAQGGLGEGCEGGQTPAGTGGSGQGAGIFNSGSLTVTNSTITGNQSEGGTGGDGSPTNGGQGNSGDGGDGVGAGIYTTNKLVVYDSTISGNTSKGGAGGPNGYSTGTPGVPGIGSAAGVAIASGTATFDNSIISGNIANTSAPNDIAGASSSKSANNLIGTGGGLNNGVNGNKVGINNPDLSPLGNYGSPTKSMVPLPSSPAIGGGSISLIPAGITTDQRGFARTTGKSVDIGADQFGDATITGSVFNDLSASGKYQKGDPGLSGWIVYLDLNHDGHFNSSDVFVSTSVAGSYSFADVPAGIYTVDIVSQASYRPTTATTATVNVTTGAKVAGPLFGQTQDALISGSVVNAITHAALSGFRVYLDLNNDGKWEASEPSVVTSSNGQWSFNIANFGTYEARIVPMAKYKTAAPTGGLFTFNVGKASARIGNIFAEQKIS